jgi:hypothetical protein
MDKVPFVVVPENIPVNSKGSGLTCITPLDCDALHPTNNRIATTENKLFIQTPVHDYSTIFLKYRGSGKHNQQGLFSHCINLSEGSPFKGVCPL